MLTDKQGISPHSLWGADTFKGKRKTYDSLLTYMYNIINTKKSWLRAETRQNPGN